MGQKLSSKLLFIYSPNSDGFYIFYISQGSVATQLRCDGIFSNHFITNFSQNVPVKKFWQSVNIRQRYGQNIVAYFLGHPVYTRVRVVCFDYVASLYNEIDDDAAKTAKIQRQEADLMRPADHFISCSVRSPVARGHSVHRLPLQ